MPFDITNKVALVTGGAQGIGFACSKELLRNKAKGIVIADVDVTKGEESTKQLNGLFGLGKVVFIPTDTSSFDEYERAFKFAVESFGHVDILVNNAGIADELNWEKTVQINLNGYANGINLALETYLRHFKSSEDAVIINTCSIAACDLHPYYPVYSTTKYAVLGMTRTWGHPAQFERTKVKVMTVCPDQTDTNIRDKVTFFNEEHAQMWRNVDKKHKIMQSPDHVGKEMVDIMKEGKGGSIWVIENQLTRYEYIVPDKEAFRPVSS